MKIAAIAALLTLIIALPALAQQPHDPCKNPTAEEQQSAALQRECKYIAAAAAMTAELNAITDGFREVARETNEVVDRLNKAVDASPK